MSPPQELFLARIAPEWATPASAQPAHYGLTMPDERPVVYLLAGLPGSGKTAHALDLESRGTVRLSVDEEMMARHGRLGVDYPAAEHMELLSPVVQQVRAQLIDQVKAGRSVVLDHGLGLRDERDAYKHLVESLGATWELLHFSADIEALVSRLADRQRLDTSAVPITEEMLRGMAASWEEPNGEGERLVR